MRSEDVKVSDLLEIAAAYNPRKISAEDFSALRRSLRFFGCVEPIVVNKRTNLIVGGHQRVKAAHAEGLETLPVVWVDLDEPSEKQLNLALNRIHGEWDEEKLTALLDELNREGADLDLTGFSEEEIRRLLDMLSDDSQAEIAAARETLAQRFGVPPFSVLDARSGAWQERKAAWRGIGLRDGETRNEMQVTGSLSGSDPSFYKQKREVEKRLGHEISTAEFEAKHYQAPNTSLEFSEGGGITSQFDPVLAELLIQWFCPPGGLVLDPFSGGPIRGSVAALLGRRYVGIDIRPEQVEANVRSWAGIIGGLEQPQETPRWIAGDSQHCPALAPGEYDLVFSCPPYADYEVYSDNPADLSTMDYERFRGSLRDIVAKAAAMLKPNRFAVFVVGEVRGKDGAFYGLVKDTIEAFTGAGLAFYNEAILVTPLGSLPIRTGRAFEASRKLGKSHQNVLVFVKGDWKEAAKALGPVEVADFLEGADAREVR